ncbi:MAG: helix-turn-helix domain-containing protein [Armatimonadota bacterium]|nr:helix-turn-helix domain-containing protein [Armatimonadota bacterium]
MIIVMPGSDLVQSVCRSLDVLELVARAEQGLSLQEVARALGVRLSTAHNLVRTLTARQFLVRTSRPVRYRLGPAVLDLASAHFSRAMVREAAEVLRSLANRLPVATLSLAEVVGGEVATTLRVSPERPGFVEQPRHRVMHPYASASALVFQAYWGVEERQEYRRRHPFAEHGAHLWGELASLDRFLDEVRRLGYAAPRFPEDPVLKVGVPLFSPGGELTAVLGVSAPADAADEKEMVHHGLAAAAHIARRAASAVDWQP